MSAKESLAGQWVSSWDLEENFQIILDVDDEFDHYKGLALVFYKNTELPNVFIPFKTKNKKSYQSLELTPYVLHWETGIPVQWDISTETKYPDVSFPKAILTKLEINTDGLAISWNANGDFGEILLEKSKRLLPSEVKVIEEATDWNSFKSYVLRLQRQENVFRGQSSPMRLCSTFHRSNRSILADYISRDIEYLSQRFSSRTRHFFDLSHRVQLGAFLNLVQHHGYPTPLLDWTMSPFVAAYFAYSGIKNSDAKYSKKKVRIYIFDQEAWKSNFPQFLILANSRPHFSIMETLAIENERLIPQQSVSSLTNIEDIESYILFCERKFKRQFIRAIDLPVSERPAVMAELAYMGVNAGTLFPGFDGMCSELREQNFNL